jgi:hypothetical protein
MTNKRIFIFLIFAVAFLSFDKEPRKIQNEDYLTHKARECTRKFYDKEFENLFIEFTSELKKKLSLSQLSDFYYEVINKIGNEKKILREQLDTILSNYLIYNRYAIFDNSIDTIVINWTFNEQMKICDFSITLKRHEFPSKYLDYKTKTSLRLPFDDKWYVYWGGRTIDENYHSFTQDQRFAYDFLQIINRKTFTGEGKKNEDYFCYGKNILAPGVGLILEIENSVTENVPGETNSSNPWGNYVIIDHGNREYSFLAHFITGSILVKKGDRVKQDQIIGKCGNSGQSSEPHLHYHLQNTPYRGQGDGLPIQFENFISNGNYISKAEPVRKQTVENKND